MQKEYCSHIFYIALCSIQDRVHFYFRKRVNMMKEETFDGYDNTIYREPYFTKDGCLYEAVEKKGEIRMVKLCDYIPVLKSEITYDDGTEQHKVFEISAVHASGIVMPTVIVSAEEMNSMKWLLEKWGALGSSGVHE